MSDSTVPLLLPLEALAPGDENAGIGPIVAAHRRFEAPAATGSLPVVLGRGEHGGPVVIDLAEAPHVLVGGTTGAGKSILVHGALLSLLARHEPRTLRLLMVDTKRLELGPYEVLPHLRHPVVFEPGGAALLLRWLALEVAERTELLAQNGCRSLSDFNERVRLARVGRGAGLLRARDPESPFVDRPYSGVELPFVVLVVDDLADVLEVEEAGVLLQHVAERGRAVGVHLLCVTQRPGAMQVPAPLKALFPTRISFRLPAVADSRTILDRPGAERLPGVGAMIVVSPSDPEGQVVQAAYVSPDVVDQAVEWYRTAAGQSAPEMERRSLEPSLRDIVRSATAPASQSEDDLSHEVDDTLDPLLREAAEVVIAAGGGQTSILQRRLKIGYGRASRLIDQLHLRGVLGPPDGARPRAVLIRAEDLDVSLGGGGAPSAGRSPAAAESWAPAAASAAPPAMTPRAAPVVGPPAPPRPAHSSRPAEAPTTPRPPLPLIDRILRFLGG